ncbi:MAG: VWA domain-containing protein [bacterium]|nr:VWA domain-containing protein [bacterium]
MKKKTALKIITILLLAHGGISFFHTTAIAREKNLVARIDQIIPDNFPNVEAFISVTGKNHEPLVSLEKENFTVYIDGEKVETPLELASVSTSRKKGTAYALLMAANGMMEGEHFENQVKAAAVLVKSLLPQDTLSLYLFAEEVKPILQTEQKNETMIDTIKECKVMGGNPHLYDALVYVARKIDESKLKRKVVIVMASGREYGSRYNKAQCCSILSEKGLPVYSIGIKQSAGKDLHRIAAVSELTGGDYLLSGTSDTIQQSMTGIIKQIEQPYLIKFKVESIYADNQLHQFQIKVKNKDDINTSFKTFIAVKNPIRLKDILTWVLIAGAVLSLFIIMLVKNLSRQEKAAAGAPVTIQNPRPKTMKELEEENRELKNRIAEQALEIEKLKKD